MSSQAGGKALSLMDSEVKSGDEAVIISDREEARKETSRVFRPNDRVIFQSFCKALSTFCSPPLNSKRPLHEAASTTHQSTTFCRSD